MPVHIPTNEIQLTLPGRAERAGRMLIDITKAIARGQLGVRKF